ncbi:MAG: hypothetical protein COW24_00400 [Candidatus Kerfeldbacteria bacterium CG15_BIG_FIL_POST_REV_8_21_14_020_45_12]|uniref:M23ase beta-sheet core domain-containing protein n=1 Tax=Candidatus Kerfeldbacteria bacterium CG15_BIG_FIL_POST_REV_8_21_14_020_45_12 TaxID=2014247 RepID=A0A2M7H584_9BACT|nr:MAG: hypothetical protein COW24_00400 [Candidatus Kerfeldbacteria bacterium CG15_BIG_FIL_POST_REV_8_21_14_020_45_12]PJA92796.1 MAG: hypothetical protein CO132_06000 [Candidatus Kerfeldbacteria bacterium CG_4_9_14_3_um_filter_45_8]
MRFARWVISGLVLLLLPFQTLAVSSADQWIWPLGIWSPTTHHGDSIGSDLYHMGTDAGFSLGEGGEVYAAATGVVQEVRERTSFGLVVLIEHTLPNGKNIVSLYGHLKPSDQPVSVGQTVSAGERIGSLGSSSENGGWATHLHFGIHRSEYTGEWVYYGHVSDPAIADDWYDPEKFVAKRLGGDIWSPALSQDLQEDRVISDILTFTVRATDLGEGISTVEVFASDDSKESWQSIASYSGDDVYPYPVYTSLAGFTPGRIYVKTVVTDLADHKTKQTVRIQYRPNADSTRHYAAFRGAGDESRLKVMLQDSSRETSFRPFESGWLGGGDVAIGDVTGDGSSDIVVVKGDDVSDELRVLSRSGAHLNDFKVLSGASTANPRVATGDIDGDGTDEIIIGSGPGSLSVIEAYEYDGTKLWRKKAIGKKHRGGVDVATGDFDGDGVDEIVAATQSTHKSKVALFSGSGKRTKIFRAFAASYKGGVNIATADVDGDGIDEIVAATNGDHIGKVRIFRKGGKRMTGRSFAPFGDNFTGSVDVSSVDWDGDGKDEIVTSQSGAGEAWVRTYRSGPRHRLLTNDRIFAEGFEGGARIDGWE